MKILAMTTILKAETIDSIHTARYIQQWDSDSELIGIGNIYLACMSHDPTDFVGDLQECKRTIKGFGGQTHYNVFIGTIKWHWEDDQGKIHKCLILRSNYVKKGGVILISPQHWATT